jgi:adenosylmethionine-8-amino-7-oxononanoate aminotransferase
MTNLWHPFADMAAVSASGEFTIERGDGVYVWDEAGRRYFDATASLWYCNVGFGRREIADAVAAQLRKLHAYSNFGNLATKPTLELADRLAELAPEPGTKVFFTSGGSDSVDTAAKLARRYWHTMGQPERDVIIVRRHAYHGMHVGGTSLSGIDGNRTDYGPLVEGIARIDWDTPASLAEALATIGPERVAAFFCEPVIGAGGVFPPPPGYLQAVRELCRESGVLFVADEVITGFGRIGGAWFASERFDLKPDMILCAKGITSGYVPLGAVLVAPRVAGPFWSEGTHNVWRHGYTYSGHAGAAAAAMANLDILEREDLLSRTGELERTLASTLAPLSDHHLVSEVRSGVGVMAAIQFAPESLAADPTLLDRAIVGLRRHGVLTRALACGALQISPAFTVEREQLVELVGALNLVLEELSSSVGRPVEVGRI